MIRLPTFLVGLSAVLALSAVVMLWQLGDHRPDGAGQDRRQVGGPFTLTDQEGHVRSDRDFRGRWMLVYFGYTQCPDVCPTTLQEIAEAVRGLGPKAKRVVPVFITLDPQRDHPATLRRYLAAFGPEFVGLTGTMAQIASVARAYRVYFAKHPLPGGTYSVDHASSIYLMSPAGAFASTLDEQEGATALKRDLESRLS